MAERLLGGAAASSRTTLGADRRRGRRQPAVRRADRRDARRRAAGAAIEVPPTIQALMSARLDRLSREERAVLEPASVAGPAFAQRWSRSSTREAGRRTRAARLRRAAPVRPLRSRPPADEERSSRFQHILIRDAAYQGLLEARPRHLHERFVAWADRVNRDRGAEYEEILGYHLEQAHRYLSELGPLDAHGRRGPPRRPGWPRRTSRVRPRRHARCGQPAAAGVRPAARLRRSADRRY